MSETVYQRQYRPFGVPVFAHSKIKSWGGWPEDVVEALKAWNRDYTKLRFDYHGLMFKCPDCQRFIKNPKSTVAQIGGFDGYYLCDDCLIERARDLIAESERCPACEGIEWPNGWHIYRGQCSLNLREGEGD